MTDSIRVRGVRDAPMPMPGPPATPPLVVATLPAPPNGGRYALRDGADGAVEVVRIDMGGTAATADQRPPGPPTIEEIQRANRAGWRR